MEELHERKIKHNKKSDEDADDTDKKDSIYDSSTTAINDTMTIINETNIRTKSSDTSSNPIDYIRALTNEVYGVCICVIEWCYTAHLCQSFCIYNNN
jgi:hypothetical protein